MSRFYIDNPSIPSLASQVNLDCIKLTKLPGPYPLSDLESQTTSKIRFISVLDVGL